jgi:tRNA 2-thiouridine synthesizing protein E
MSDQENLRLDADGYLKDPSTWTEKIACALADREGISDECPLSQERMDILKFVRDYYDRFEAFPIIRAVCKNVGQEKTCQYQQFPDPITAWKIAGLPKPNPEVLAKIRH